jgi:hypothetical protein
MPMSLMVTLVLVRFQTDFLGNFMHEILMSSLVLGIPLDDLSSKMSLCMGKCPLVKSQFVMCVFDNVENVKRHQIFAKLHDDEVGILQLSMNGFIFRKIYERMIDFLARRIRRIER